MRFLLNKLKSHLQKPFNEPSQLIRDSTLISMLVEVSKKNKLDLKWPWNMYAELWAHCQRWQHMNQSNTISITIDYQFWNTTSSILSFCRHGSCLCTTSSTTAGRGRDTFLGGNREKQSIRLYGSHFSWWKNRWRQQKRTWRSGRKRWSWTSRWSSTDAFFLTTCYNSILCIYSLLSL